MTDTVISHWGFLCDEERVAYHQAWIADTVDTLFDRPTTDTRSVFVAANLVGLLLFRSGQLDAAGAACRAEIDFIMRHKHTRHWPDIAAYALQPQINLLRMDGYAGDADRALDGLAALEGIAHGEGATFSDLTWEPDTFDGHPDLDRKVRAFARNVRVSDTCKILWRRHRTDELLTAADRFQTLWPAMIAGGGPQHAAETAWLVTPDAQPEPSFSDLEHNPPALRRLACVRMLHLAASAARDDRGYAMKVAGVLAEQMPTLAGPYASELTVPRWRAALGAIMIEVDLAGPGCDLLIQARCDAIAMHDSTLLRDVEQRLTAAGVTGHEPPPAAASGTVPPERIATLAERLHDRLAIRWED